MGTCSECGDGNVLTRNCNHCGREVCTSHTLPEKHDCPAVTHYGKGTKHLQSDIDAKLSDDETREASMKTSAQDSRIARDRTGVSKNRKPKTPLEEHTNRQQSTDDTSGDDDGPKPLEQVSTHGGSGRNLDREDLPSSPDVKPDGSVDDSDVDAVSGERRQVERKSGFQLRLDQIREHKWTYITLIVVLAVAQFGLGIDILGLLHRYLLS